jgi:hypothetical protein
VKPDFVAPGVWVTSDIPTTVVSVMQEWALENMPQLIKQPGYMMDCGTSFATPYVAAMASKQYSTTTAPTTATQHHSSKGHTHPMEHPNQRAGKDIFTGYGLVVGPH